MAVSPRTQRRFHGPAIFVFPDCFTALGGNAVREFVGDRTTTRTIARDHSLRRPQFRTHASREHRGCFGKSSGGYGSIIHGMQDAKYWGAIASHSGDAVFRFRLLERLAEHAELARQAPPPQAQARRLRRGPRIEPQGPNRWAGRRTHQAVSGARVEKGEAHHRGRPLHHEPLHGGHLRSGPEGASRLSGSLQPRVWRGHREALEAMARARLDQPGLEISSPPRVADVASMSIAAGATSITSTMVHASCRSGSRQLASATPTRNSMTTTPTSTTRWTSACLFSIGR